MLKVHLKKGENREPYINALRFIVKYIKIDSASCLVTSVSGFVAPAVWSAMEAVWWLLVMVFLLEIGDSSPATAGFSQKLLCDYGM